MFNTAGTLNAFLERYPQYFAYDRQRDAVRLLPQGLPAAASGASGSPAAAKWFDFDDSNVRPIEDEQVLTTPTQGEDSAYLLVYRSVDLAELGAGAAASSTGGDAAAAAKAGPPEPPAFWRKTVTVRAVAGRLVGIGIWHSSLACVLASWWTLTHP